MFKSISIVRNACTRNMSSSSASFRIALIQLNVTADKSANINNALKYVQTAKENSAEIAILPECFNSPYGTKFFPKYAEEIPAGETCRRLSECAKNTGIYIVGGSIPEVEGSHLYNTCTVWNPQGQLVAKHRKIHLFDIDIPGKITFKESDALSPGNDVTTFETDKCKVGLGICYDVRFAELANVYRKLGCSLLIYPGAFNMTTGPLHWELLFRARACDNQLFVAGVSPARDVLADYHAWGHSMFVNPLGQVESQAEHEEAIIYGIVVDDSCCFIQPSSNIANAVSICFKDAFSKLAIECVSGIITEKLGPKAARLFNIVRDKKFIELEQIPRIAMLADKEAKQITYKLLEENFIQMQELRKPTPAAAAAPTKIFILFYVDVYSVIKMAMNMAFKNSYNLMVRLNEEQLKHNHIFARKKEADSVTKALREQRASEEQIAEMVNNILTPSEISLLESVHKVLTRLYTAQLQVDETIFLMQVYVLYHRSGPPEPKTRKRK